MLTGILIGVLTLGILTGAGILTAVCLCAGKTRETRPSDCILVLGARVWPDGRLSNSLLYRCETALEAWRAGLAPEIIVAGGGGDDEPVSEARAMRDWLVAQGVPEERVHMEDTSTDTRENFSNAMAIMADRGWRTAAVVTNDYHMERALWIARDAGLEACGLPAPSPKKPWTVIVSRCRETVSWTLYGLRRISGVR